MNTINVNFENLTEQEREQLLALVEKANAPAPWWKGTKFDIAKCEEYYYVSGRSVVAFDVNNSNWDEKSINFGNACKDKSYMERRAQEIKLYNLMSNFAEVVNDGWKPDWSNEDEMKWSIMHEASGAWSLNVTYSRGGANEVHFKTHTDAQRCIDEIILPFERGEL